MQISDEDLRRELADVPEVPDTVYGLVQRRVRRGVQLRRWAWAVAASLALLAGGGAYQAARSPASQNTASATVADDLDQELREISAFLNGGTIDEELETYALVSFDEL
jgi:hypothetical protein